MQVATKFPANALKHRPDVCKYISKNEVCGAVAGSGELDSIRAPTLMYIHL